MDVVHCFYVSVESDSSPIEPCPRESAASKRAGGGDCFFGCQLGVMVHTAVKLGVNCELES